MEDDNEDIDYNNFENDEDVDDTSQSMTSMVNSTNVSAPPIINWNYSATTYAGYSTATIAPLSGTFSINTSTSTVPLLVVNSSGNSEIVRVDPDGTVVWPNGIDIDAAKEALEQSFTLAFEARAGITKRVKAEIRDKIFEEIIDILKERGTITVEDLQLFWRSSKIIDKLSGIID